MKRHIGYVASILTTLVLAVQTEGAVQGVALNEEISVRHRAVARRAAAEGMVLLANERATLPLARGTALSLFGDWQTYQTGGGGSSLVKPTRVVGFKAGLEEAGFSIVSNGSDTAVYVLFRAARENSDIPREAYAIRADERNALADLRKRGFRRVVLVANGGLLPNVSSLVEDGLVDAALFTWFPGQEGCAAIGDILCGAVNPSGRLADTLAKGVSDYASDRTFMESPDYIPYDDDIFVGYRYFETIPGAAEKVTYPFGHGLSYTTFEILPRLLDNDGARVSVRVDVTNTGKVPGRRSVLVYTSQRGGCAEHPARELRAFAKTRLLTPGETQTLEIGFDCADLTVFDDEGWSGKFGSWVMDKGVYTVWVGGNVRDVTSAGMFDVAELQVLSTPGVKCNPALLARRLRADGTDGARDVRYCGRDGIDWKSNTDYPTATVVNVTLYDVAAGRATMDAFLDQFALADLVKLTHGHPQLVHGGTGSIGGGLEQYGVYGAQTCDGPCGVRRDMPSTAFPCSALVACAFDTALAQDIGRVIGEEAADVDFDLLLAPGLCIHRHPLCGRNFEYFSEDPLVSGVMASAFVKGVQSTGVGATLKHFCCNNRETNRRLASAVISERALREIYLRGFERAVREAKPWAIMTSYNHLNGVNTSALRGLLNGILRDEWGFDGVTMTDWYTIAPMWRELNNGNDVKMSHDLELFTARSARNTGVGENMALEAYKAEGVSYSYLYRDSVRASARRVCELVMKSHRFRRNAK